VRRGREPALWPAVVVATLLLGIAFFVLQQWLERGRLSDIPVYDGYAHLMRAGKLPYRDFTVEYPPVALPAFLLPAYLPWSYATSFAVAMGLCGAGCIVAAAAVFRAVGAGTLRASCALLGLGLSPMALGALFDTRFDLWPVLLALAAVAATLRERPVTAGSLYGLAFAAKLWPLALLPVGLTYLWRRRGQRSATATAAAFAVAAAACFLPFAALAPGGVGHSLTGQLDRPLQIESLGAAILTALHHTAGLSLTTVTTHGSQNLAGSLPDTVAAVSSGLQLAAIVGIWAWFTRLRRPSGESMLVASSAVVTAFVAFGKVFSPQFLIWLVPFVPLVRGRRGLGASLLLLASLWLTRTWFPARYWELALGHEVPYVWFLLARDVVVVALAVVLAWPRGLQGATEERHRSRLEALRAIRAQAD
jgi:hypothetical protein